MSQYLVKCKKCKKENVITINDNKVEYPENNTLLSARFRADMQWGFECLCGNDTRLCKQELEVTNVQVKGSSKEVVEAVIDNLKATPDDSFIMSRV